MENPTKSTPAHDEEPEITQVAAATREAIAYRFNTEQVRTIKAGDTVWFAAPDVCNILGLENVSRALSRLVEEERSFADLFSSGQIRQTAMVNESGLIALVLSSRKPDAIKFRRWITSEVLPSIWKTGGYTSGAQQQAIDHSDIADIINRRAGIYIVIVDGQQRTMKHTDGGEIINIATEALSSMMAGCLIRAEGALKLLQAETLLPGLDTSFASEALEGAIGHGAEVARRYVTITHNRIAEREVSPVGLPN